MPRKSRSKQQPEAPAGREAAVDAQYERPKDQLSKLKPEEWTQPGEVPLQEPDYKLAKYEAPERPAAQIKTARSFVGRIASGRGRTVTADDSSFAIESTNPLTAGEIALAQRNGFDDFSEQQNGTIMVGDKAEVRRAGGDINHVARALTSRDAGRER